MQIRIGKFCNLPLYLNIPAPVRMIRELLGKEQKMLAFVQPELQFYDQLKAKHEGTISIIPKENLSKNNQYIYAMTSVNKIVVEPRFLLLPKMQRLFTLWHEYGHCAAQLHDEEGNKSSFRDVYEAFADFYACCKLKLHFGTYFRICCFSPFKDIFTKNQSKENLMLYEKRYADFSAGKVSLGEKVVPDYVYHFYRDKDNLISWYTFCFREVCDMDYHIFFDWDEFLAETGWDNDVERRKYIS